MSKNKGNADEEIQRLLQGRNIEGHDRKHRIIGGKVSESHHIYDDHDIRSEGPNGSMDSLKLSCSYSCDFGHIVDQKIRLVGRCEVCGRLTCETAGCNFTCIHCGRALCRKHASVYSDDEVYCHRCRPIKWLKIFFCLRRKENNK